MSKILVWDLPTRVFHALLTVGFIAAFAIAQFSGEHSAWFPYHMLLGIVLGVMVVLRVIWGVVGTKYARFESLLFSPSALLKYLRSAFTSRGERYTGHNPGSGYAILAMLLLTLLVVATGLLMSTGSETAEELHSLAAYALLAVAAIHVVGVVWHTIRHRENIARSMITGVREGQPDDAIPSSRPIVALIFVAVVAYLGVGLFRDYDPSTHETRIPIAGAVIHLGEGEDHE